MTSPAPASSQPEAPKAGSIWMFSRLPTPLAGIMTRLSLGGKLNWGFGVLVLFALVVAGISYFSSADATTYINQTVSARVPAAYAAGNAQTNLLRMLSASRGYLALDDVTSRAGFLRDYRFAQQRFEQDLAQLEKVGGLDNLTLITLTDDYATWKAQQEQLFALSDDKLAREPALSSLILDVQPLVTGITQDTRELLAEQAQRTPSVANTELLKETASFQSTFFQVIAGLRGYITTRNPDFQFEYQANLLSNQAAWATMQKEAANFTTTQKALLARIEQNRSEFLRLLEPMIAKVESDRYREDLYQFRTGIVPAANDMLTQLATINDTQQQQLRNDLGQGRRGLATARQITLIVGLIAVLLALFQAYVFRENIAGPIQRLTNVAERIRGGQLEAQAQIETGDEIGTLAETFNNMTGQLRQTLQQVRKEKKRTDDLLNVVIPIGVELTQEKDFNRLLEKMLREAKQFCNANTGVIYLATEDQQLKYALFRDTRRQLTYGGTTGREVPLPLIPLLDANSQPNLRHAAAHATLQAKTVNIPNAREATEFDFAPLPGVELHLEGEAWLTIPLKNSEEQVLGVLQLIDPRERGSDHIIPFDTNLQQMMESFSSLAVAALEAYIREQALRTEIQQLRIEIDEAKRAKQVSEIVDSESFKDLRAKAQELRARKQARMTGG